MQSPSFARGVFTPILSVILIGALLFQTACSKSAVMVALDLVVTTATTTTELLQTTGVIPPATATLVLAYLQEIPPAVDFATTELASTDSAAVKATRITQELATIIAPNLPPGTAETILAAVENVAQTIFSFLADLAPAAASHDRLATTPGAIPLSKGDISALAKITKHNALLRIKLDLVAHSRHR